MSMLGATLEDLTALSTKLEITATDVGATRDAAVLLTSEVVEGVTESATRAQQQIATEMETLELSVSESAAQADATNWTGQNADRFREAAHGFQEAMLQAERTTTETFEVFRAAVVGMTETLDEFVRSLSISLSDAETAAHDMARAVTDQHENLDQVMNVGLSVR